MILSYITKKYLVLFKRCISEENSHASKITIVLTSMRNNK
jgi:hypothetical protein